MKITIETIPHGDQRYPTAGDWMFDNDHLVIRVSDLGDWRYSMAVGLHEAVEALLCRNDGVDGRDVDAFDFAYQELHHMEPGDDPAAPYHRQHCFATAVERILIAALGVSWAEYEAAAENL